VPRIERKLGRALSHLDALQQQGLVERTQSQLRATASGRLVLNAIIRELAS
jgi:coproporphyrinogen III oxidase-like Fe-S oxidoreductase